MKRPLNEDDASKRRTKRLALRRKLAKRRVPNTILNGEDVVMPQLSDVNVVTIRRVIKIHGDIVMTQKGNRYTIRRIKDATVIGRGFSRRAALRACPGGR